MAEAGVKPEHTDLMMPALHPQAAEASGPKPRYKSFRKKYRKMKIRFDQIMEDANELFVAENRAADVARRLQEENDKILDILLEVNESRHLPLPRQFDLTSPTHRSSNPADGPRFRTVPLPTKSLDNMETNITHTSPSLPDPSALPLDLRDGPGPYPGYLTPEHEEAYLDAMDNTVDRLPEENILLSESETKQPEAQKPKPHLTERDFAVQNPVSVYNWLRKHQPQVFDGKDKESEKGAKSPPPSRKRKGDKTKQEPTDPLEDELGGDPDVVSFGGSARGKRKKDDDTYRPKGGSSRPQKRKRETAEDGKNGKRARKSGGDEEA